MANQTLKEAADKWMKKAEEGQIELSNFEKNSQILFDETQRSAQNTLHSRTAELESTIAAMRADKKRIEEDRAKAQKETEKATEEKKVAREELVKVKEELNVLQAEIETKAVEKFAAKQHFEKLLLEKSALISLLEEKNFNSQSELDRMRGEKNGLEDKSKELRKLLEDTQGKLAMARGELITLRREMNERLKRKMTQNGLMETEEEQLEGEKEWKDLERNIHQTRRDFAAKQQRSQMQQLQQLQQLQRERNYQTLQQQHQHQQLQHRKDRPLSTPLPLPARRQSMRTSGQQAEDSTQTDAFVQDGVQHREEEGQRSIPMEEQKYEVNILQRDESLGSDLIPSISASIPEQSSSASSSSSSSSSNSAPSSSSAPPIPQRQKSTASTASQRLSVYQDLTSTMVDVDADRAPVDRSSALISSRRRASQMVEEKSRRERDEGAQLLKVSMAEREREQDRETDRERERGYSPAFSDDLGPASPLNVPQPTTPQPHPVTAFNVEEVDDGQFVVEEVHVQPPHSQSNSMGTMGVAVHSAALSPALSPANAAAAAAAAAGHRPPSPSVHAFRPTTTRLASIRHSAAVGDVADPPPFHRIHSRVSQYSQGGAVATAALEEARANVVRLQKENEQLSEIIRQMRIDLLSLAAKSTAAKHLSALRTHNDQLKEYGEQMSERLKKASQHNSILMQKVDTMTRQLVELQNQLNGNQSDAGAPSRSALLSDDSELRFLRNYSAELHETIAHLQSEVHKLRAQCETRDVHFVGKTETLESERKNLETTLREVEKAMRAREKSREDERKESETLKKENEELKSEMGRLKKEREKLMEISSLLKADLARIMKIHYQPQNIRLNNDENYASEDDATTQQPEHHKQNESGNEQDEYAHKDEKRLEHSNETLKESRQHSQTSGGRPVSLPPQMSIVPSNSQTHRTNSPSTNELTQSSAAPRHPNADNPPPNEAKESKSVSRTEDGEEPVEQDDETPQRDYEQRAHSRSRRNRTTTGRLPSSSRESRDSRGEGTTYTVSARFRQPPAATLSTSESFDESSNARFSSSAHNPWDATETLYPHSYSTPSLEVSRPPQRSHSSKSRYDVSPATGRASERMTAGQKAALQKLKKKREHQDNAIQLRLQAVARIRGANQTQSPNW